MTKQDSLQMVDPKTIYLGENVRTDFTTVAELIASIEIHGLLQPPTVVAEVSHGPTGVLYAWRCVYGHRRTFAAIEAGLQRIPVLVRTLDAADRIASQLVENLHRANLSLADTANAVRDLYDEHGSVSLVAEMIGKGKPWVSKMLALTADAGGTVARALMATDDLTDLELAYTLTQIERRAGVDEAKVIGQGIISGQHDRASVRKHLADLETSAHDDATVTPRTDAPLGGATLYLTRLELQWLRLAVDQGTANIEQMPMKLHVSHMLREAGY